MLKGYAVEKISKRPRHAWGEEVFKKGTKENKPKRYNKRDKIESDFGDNVGSGF